MSYNKGSDILAVAGALRAMGFGRKRPIPRREMIKSRIVDIAAQAIATALSRASARSLIGKINALAKFLCLQKVSNCIWR